MMPLVAGCSHPRDFHSILKCENRASLRKCKSVNFCCFNSNNSRLKLNDYLEYFLVTREDTNMRMST